MKWWEKTVEYFFVKKYVTDTAISPLDGPEEKAGDAIFSKKNKLILIEFKKDLNSVRSERKKFHNFELARKELKDYDSHHFLIYGLLDNNHFIIKAQTYFSEQEIDVEDALYQGKTVNEFNKYLEKFLKLKGASIKNGGESGGGVLFENYGLVAIINDDKGIVSCLKLSEYIEKKLNLFLQPKVKRQPYKGPSM